MRLSIVLSFFFCGLALNIPAKNNNKKENTIVAYTPLQKNVSKDSLNHLENIIKGFAKQKKYDSAIFYSKQLLHKALLLVDSTYMLYANHRQGIYFKRKVKLDSSFIYYNQALKISLQLKDSATSSSLFLSMANIQNRIGDYSGSAVTAIDGLKYLSKNKKNTKTFTLNGLYHAISTSSREQQNLEEALKWNTKALELSKNVRGKNILLNTKAIILTDQFNYNNSIKIFKDLLTNSDVIENELEFSRVQSNLGYTLFLKEEQNPESRKLLLSALNIRTKNNTTSGLIASNIHLAKYYKKSNSDIALKYANEALKNGQHLKNPVAILEALDLIIPLKNELELPVSKEAILYSKSQKKIEKLRQNIRRIYATTKYNNDKLNQDNLILKARTAKKEKQNALYLFAIILTLGLVAFIIYYKNTQNKKAKLEASYKTELRLAKKIHDELGNDIFSLMNQIENSTSSKTPNRSSLLEFVKTIYLKVRDINKEYTLIDTGSLYGEQLLEMLNSYQSTTTRIITKEFATDFWNEISVEKKIELFRVLRELFTNMKKHSNVSFVGITFSKENNTVLVKYADDNTSFNTQKIVKGNGLTNVENRIKNIDGTINFESNKAIGLKVIIQFPI